MSDINQFAASIVAQTTGSKPHAQADDSVDLNDKETVSKIMREMGRRSGIKGAATLNGSLTPKQRSLSAQKAAKARWANRSSSRIKHIVQFAKKIRLPAGGMESSGLAPFAFLD